MMLLLLLLLTMQGHTGVVSVPTTLMNLAANAARVATSVYERLQPFVVVGFVISFAMNAVLLVQILVYWRAVGPARPSKPEWSMV